MHIVHLALATDSITSVLLDLTDPGIIDGASRDARLKPFVAELPRVVRVLPPLDNKTNQSFLCHIKCLQTRFSKQMVWFFNLAN